MLILLHTQKRSWNVETLRPKNGNWKRFTAAIKTCSSCINSVPTLCFFALISLTCSCAAREHDSIIRYWFWWSYLQIPANVRSSLIWNVKFILRNGNSSHINSLTRLGFCTKLSNVFFQWKLLIHEILI